LLARTDGNGSAFYHTDGNGNVTALVNGSGVLVAKYLYDSFGNTLGMWGALAAANTQRFSSKEQDPRSGLYYYGYRWYDPNLQRWLSRDPIQETGGINLYGFVGNEPINKIDPLGLYNPISGPNGPVGPGSGLADPSNYLPPPAFTLTGNYTAPVVSTQDIIKALQDEFSRIANGPYNFYDMMGSDFDTKFYYEDPDNLYNYDGIIMTAHDLNYIGVGAGFAGAGWSKCMAEAGTEAWYHGLGPGHSLSDDAGNAVTAMSAGYNAFNTYGPLPYNFNSSWSVVNQGTPGYGFYP
jgi:RHS repeat-associated protein